MFHNGHGATAEDRFLHYKRELHQQLIAGMDLSAIGAMDEAELRVEVRQAAESLCRNSSDLLNLSERERLVSEVLDETFGLGPLEPLIRDPTITDILINGPKTIYVERHGRLIAVRGRLQRRASPAPDRPTHREPGRAAGGRDHADGRRPVAGREPRQRDHPAAGTGWYSRLDPAVRGPAPARSTT